ncbi:preprotein translocase subunit SecE [Corynebacterium liangguodongii]|uniref:Protein translocase subunit SecE n=1 Tax=Corynebacterium liangguodongii TaxID=2079535 RepID=A0A2S0WC45_9CORY|nr:preprotein translocase subunit SecE [Corynebacterium liangguodongii]AWB83333.1 preprotein translocase subunit SecE [Corynebacterium liangguodongii]PWC00577.1 preprotein translocase subunit SecE [Corynebacterium liangguodongii]
MTNPQGLNPAQPTGKRQLRGASPVSSGSVEGKRAADKADKAEGTGDKVGGGPAAFPGEVVSEMRKVIWPTGRQMFNYTLIVFAFLIVLTALVWSVDWVAGWAVEKILVR